jgi:50S ribosomal subunit-associated GTPase HflX
LITVLVGFVARSASPAQQATLTTDTVGFVARLPP